MSDSILLAIPHKKNQLQIKERLDSLQYTLCEGQLPDAFQQSFDLCIVDDVGLNQYKTKLEAHKKAQAPVFAPVLLITQGDVDELATGNQWKMIDELLRTPIETVELQVRVQNLLELRKLSLQFEQCSKEVLERGAISYRQLFDASLDALLVLDSNGRFIDANPAAIERYGYSLQELKQKTAADLAAPDLKSSAAKQIHQALEWGTIFQWRHQCKDGSQIPVEISAVPIDLDGQRYILSNVRDITERVQAEQELRHSKERYRALLAATSEVSYHMSPNWDEMYFLQGQGFVPDTPAPTKNWLDIYIYPEDQAAVMAAIQAALNTKTNLEIEHRVIQVDGSLGWTFSRATPILDAQGEITSWFGMASNITQRKTAEQALQESESRYRQLLDVAPIGVAVHVDGKIVFTNPAVARLLKAESPAELVGKPIQAIIDPAGLASAADRIRRMLAGEQGLYPAEDRYIRLDGSTVPVEVMAVPLTYGGKPGVQVMVTDITERKRSEEALKNSQARVQRLFDQQVAINKLSLALGTTTNLDDMYQIIYQHTQQLADTWTFIVALYDSQNKIIRAAYTIHEGQNIDVANLPTLSLRETGKGTQSQVIHTGEPLYIPDYRQAVQSSQKVYIVEKNGSYQEETLNEYDQENTTRSAVYVPMKAKGEIIGVMQLQSTRPNAYTQEDIDLLTGMANVAAIAIQNVSLFNETQRRLQELEVINSISTTLRKTETLEEMLPAVLGQTLSILSTSSGSLVLFDPQNDAFYLKISEGWFEQIRTLPPRHAGISGHVVQSGEPYIVADYANDPLANPETRALMPAGWSGACLPIFAGHQIIGLLYVALELPRQITPNEINLINTFSDMIGSAVHRTRLHEKTMHQISQLTALRSIDQAITGSMNMDFMLEMVINQISQHLETDATRILLLEPGSNLIKVAASQGFRFASPQNTILLQHTLASQAVLSRKIVVIQGHKQLTKEFSNMDAASERLIENEGFADYYGLPLIAKGDVKGVLEIFFREDKEKNQDWQEFLHALARQTAIAIDNATLFQNSQRSRQDLAVAYDHTLEGWAHALELRDTETEGHSQRVTDTTIELARALGVENKQLIHIRRGALLHDIGKMGIPDSILHKPGPLDEEEWDLMRQHPVFAYNMLNKIEYLRPALDIPHLHHEKWDGSGYPNGLRGPLIPLAARIFAIVDVWDALSSDRPYRKAWPPSKIRDYIQSQSGIHFDPQVVAAFLNIIQSQ